MMEDTLADTTLRCLISKPFTAADVDKPIVVVGAGAAAADLETTIAGYTSASQVTLADPCTTSITVTVADGDMTTTVADGAMTAGGSGSTLTCSTSHLFSTVDVGKRIVVDGAGPGGGALVTTIAAWSSNAVVTLADECSATVAGATVTWACGTLTCSPSAPFSAGDVGKTIVVEGAGLAGADLFTTIEEYTSSSVVALAAGCGTTVAGTPVHFGTTAARYGVALVGDGAAGSDIVLVKDQNDPTENGLYWANTGGPLTNARCTEPLVPSRAVAVSEGNRNAHTCHTLVTQGATTPGVTALDFSPQNFVYSVRDFGARGDGATDDTSAINATIAAANAAQGGIVYFPGGNYKATDALTTLGMCVFLRGERRGGPFADRASVITLHTYTGTFIQIGQRTPPCSRRLACTS